MIEHLPSDIAMENHHVSLENSPFQWPFSIAMLNYQRVCYGVCNLEIMRMDDSLMVKHDDET